MATSPSAPWAELFTDGRGRYTVLLTLGTLLGALQVLVVAIIMPTVVADVGGAAYYTWPSMLYTVGSIIGSAAVGPVWTALGSPRRAYALSGAGFLAGTIGCALAPDMAWLNAARLVQGLAGGLVLGGSFALVSGLFPGALRTRVLAIQQGTFTFSHLLGPVVGGLFAQMGWWRGSFWCMVPFVLAFTALAWMVLPEKSEARPARAAFPIGRLSVLAAGVFCVALAGPVQDVALRALLIALAVFLVFVTFRLDGRAANRLYPSHALSLRSTVGLTLWIMMLTAWVQTALTLFLPLLLQVVHGISPVYVSFLNIVISFAWTLGTFWVASWTGRRERWALLSGPLFMIVGLAGIVATMQAPALWMLTLFAFLFGLGQGTYYVHIIARTMARAPKGEERVTSSALPSIRSVGTAFSAAVSGMLAVIAGLGDATRAETVGPAVAFVYSMNMIAMALALVFMVMLIRRE